MNSTLGVNFSNSLQLFDVIFSFENHHYDCVFGDIEVVESGTFSTQSVQNPLAIHIQDSNSNDTVNFEFDYNTNYFNKEDIETLVQRYERIIDYFSSNPKNKIETAPILSAQEILDLQRISNGAEQPLFDQNLVHRIVKVLNENPEEVIVEDTLRKLTSQGLLNEAKILAANLQSEGVLVGDAVAIMTPRSVDSFVAMLGVLLCGGHFVHIASSLPEDRKNYMVKKSQVKIVVYKEINKDLIPDGKSLDMSELLPKEFVEVTIPFNNPSYIIYTSGTSGMPKGVAISNGSLTNMMDFTWREVLSNYGKEATIGFISSFNFDASIINIFASLVFGLRLVVAPEEVRKDGKLIAAYLNDNDITVCDGIPTMIHGMIKRLPQKPESFPVRHFIMGGEAIKPEFANELFSWFGDANCKITNAYGPTECTVYSSYYTFDKHNVNRFNDIPIGYPLDNTAVWILDETGNPLVPGQKGEICIGGSGLATGYVNDQDLTDKYFRHNAVTETVLYHTGDIGRWNEEGVLFYHGRMDSQVKVRGYRIELSEIEHWLAKLEHVEQATVLVQQKGQQNSLLAFVQSSAELDTSEMKSELRRYLPEYMIPTFLHSLKEIPLTNTGKIDRKSLLDLASQRKQDKKSTPKGLTEEQIAEIMAEVLEVPSVDVEEGFFSQGGDSLGLVFMLAEIEEQFNRSISMSQFGSMKSVREIAKFLDTNDEIKQEQILIEDVVPDLSELENTTSQLKSPSSSLHAFITGGTGFVGAFLINEVQDQFDSVTCLVRARDLKSAKLKLEATFERYAISSVNWDKIRVVLGDLSKESVGLSSEDLQLVSEASHIYHCGAEVNFVKDFNSVKTANVNSTLSLLQLAKQSNPSSFNYISTKGVFKSDSSEFNEKSSVENESHYYDKGYSSSKWVSEVITDRSRSLGVEANIYRLGRITGHSNNAIARTDDFFHRLIEGCLRIASFPIEAIHSTTDLTPVDITAKSIVALSLNNTNATYHLVNNRLTSYGEFVKEAGVLGVQMKVEKFDDWMEKVLEINKVDSQNPFFLITPILKQKSWFSVNKSVFDSEITAKELKEFEIKWPESRSLWNKYIINSLDRIRIDLNLIKK
ncbi:MAG: amino acid adenylation domain-containing protein/thioester reductase-like protein [Arenicella sp.]